MLGGSMARKGGPRPAWYDHDRADAYLLAAAHQLGRAATRPFAAPLPPPSASATLFCAFAAEAYVNVALVRIVGDDEYRMLARMPVRSKFFLATRLGLREAWFEGGEQVLEDITELFLERNRLVHAQPEPWYFEQGVRQAEEAHSDLRNVARWLAATVEATARLGRSHAELGEFERVAGPLNSLSALLRAFVPERDGIVLQRHVRALLATLLREDEEHFLDDQELEQLLAEQDPDWDLRGFDN